MRCLVSVFQRHTKSQPRQVANSKGGIYFSSSNQKCLTGDESRIKRALDQNYFMLWQISSKHQVRDTKGNWITAQPAQRIPKLWKNDSKHAVSHLYKMRLSTLRTFLRLHPSLRGDFPTVELLLLQEGPTPNAVSSDLHLYPSWVWALVIYSQWSRNFSQLGHFIGKGLCLLTGACTWP